MFWLALIVIVALALVYWFVVRPILKQQPMLSAAFKAEASLWDQFQAKITGWRTKIAARLTVISGLLVGLYDQALPVISGQDWTPLTAKIPAWSLPVGLVLIGMLFGWLRKITDNPPQLITQKDDAGDPKVVALVKPAA